jgi:hypothetical protein
VRGVYERVAYSRRVHGGGSVDGKMSICMQVSEVRIIEEWRMGKECT